MDIKEIFKKVFLSKQEFKVIFFSGYDYNYSTIDNMNNFVNVRGEAKYLNENIKKFSVLKNVDIKIY